MMLKRKPYLVVPKFIEQPTWGGNYITTLKSWENVPFLTEKKIGQSYELYSDSKLLLEIDQSDDKRCIPELGYADTPDIMQKFFTLRKNHDYTALPYLIEQYPREILGRISADNYRKKPLLIKINQSAGNSFQLHIKPGIKHKRWQCKPESWYYLEDGFITFGIKPNIYIADYKKACLLIEKKVMELSKKILEKSLSLDDAKRQIKEFIYSNDPHQFVNLHHIKKGEMVDLSLGGIHHSWEENLEACPLGNVLYEVQLNVMDPVSTIRSFDQGKIKSDGTIRKVHIEDYFQLIDTDPDRNDLKKMKIIRKENKLLKTKYYSLDILEISQPITETTNNSFVHLFVRNGKAQIKCDEGKVILGKGHSCLVPEFAKTYRITPFKDSVILKTYIENG